MIQVLKNMLQNILHSEKVLVSTFVQDWSQKQNIPLSLFDSVGSTNDEAKKEAFTRDEDFHVYVAKTQSAGRGRRDHTWVSGEPDTQLLATWSICLSGAAQAITAPLIGLGLYQALEDTFPGKNWSIKPPNDIYLDSKKVLGILVETLQKGDSHQLIVGVGLNVWDHPHQVEEAGSIQSCCRDNPERIVHLLERFHAELIHAARSCLAPNLTELQRARLLAAIQKSPVYAAKPILISPFGDLVMADETLSWRNL